MKPQLTIVVPVRNMSGKLGNLKSWITTQNHDDLEIIIVEDEYDHATSLEIIEIIKAINSPKIRHISGKFGGPGNSRNAGKEIAEGKWITFWDADDRGYPDVALKSIIELDKESKLDMLVFSFDICDWTTQQQLKVKPIDLPSASLNSLLDSPGIWRMCFRSELIKEVDFPNYRMAEDQVFLAQVVNKSPNIGFIDQILYSYFRNVPGQLTRSNDAISDLKYSTMDILKYLDSSPTSLFLIELFVRQCFSGIKYGSLKQRIFFSSKVLKYILFKSFLLKSRVVIKVMFS